MSNECNIFVEMLLITSFSVWVSSEPFSGGFLETGAILCLYFLHPLQGVVLGIWFFTQERCTINWNSFSLFFQPTVKKQVKMFFFLSPLKGVKTHTHTTSQHLWGTHCLQMCFREMQSVRQKTSPSLPLVSSQTNGTIGLNKIIIKLQILSLCCESLTVF